MAEFKAITTQEEFDAAIGERLKREQATVRKEYEGYLSPEEVAKRYAGYLSPDDEKAKYKGYLSPEEAAKKDAKIKGYETDSVKTRIALEKGLPYELASRLSGETEEDIRKDAEGLSRLIGQQKQDPPPLKSSETEKGNNDAAYKAMLSGLKGE